jgi:flagellin
MNAYRNYNNNTSALSSNLEKLSSGYKINRAGDDAAGLAISEKMRAQISGLDQAQSNVKDGISLVKTGEGAMQEVQDMLNRMVTLATQSANGTYDVETDRNNLQKEVDALKSEINRIADSANFNGINLLDGSMSTSNTSTDLTPSVSVSQVKTASLTAQSAEFSINLDGFTLTETSTTVANASVKLVIGDATLTSDTFAPTGTVGATIGASTIASAFANQTVTINGLTYTAAVTGSVVKLTTTAKPTTASEAKGDFNVTISTATSGSTKVTDGATVNKSTEVITPGVVAAGQKQAVASFDLTDAWPRKET